MSVSPLEPVHFVLILNAGSSSLKFALFRCGPSLERVMSGSMNGVGRRNATLKVKTHSGDATPQRLGEAAASSDPLTAILNAIKPLTTLEDLAAVGHRVVHGGPRYGAPQRVTPELLSELQRLSPFDPSHLPAEIKLIETLQALRPNLLQVACFDTAFHHAMPRVAQLLPIPRRYEKTGVRRYGFHGLSYQFLLEELQRLGDPAASRGRVIFAHLGNGASMAAVRDGQCLDTSMSFTPASGLPMGTRTGDLDPGLVAYLAQTENMTAAQFQNLVNHQSGLLGVSETSGDMRELLAQENRDARAAEAVALFCYQAKKCLGAFVAVLGGIDTLVFAGGIGENCPSIRHRICLGLEFLGLIIDESPNTGNASLISATSSRVRVWVIPTDEEVVIARSVSTLLSGKDQPTNIP